MDLARERLIPSGMPAVWHSVAKVTSLVPPSAVRSVGDALGRDVSRGLGGRLCRFGPSKPVGVVLAPNGRAKRRPTRGSRQAIYTVISCLYPRFGQPDHSST